MQEPMKVTTLVGITGLAIIAGLVTLWAQADGVPDPWAAVTGVLAASAIMGAIRE